MNRDWKNYPTNEDGETLPQTSKVWAKALDPLRPREGRRETCAICGGAGFVNAEPIIRDDIPYYRVKRCSCNPREEK